MPADFFRQSRLVDVAEGFTRGQARLFAQPFDPATQALVAFLLQQAVQEARVWDELYPRVKALRDTMRAEGVPDSVPIVMAGGVLSSIVKVAVVEMELLHASVAVNLTVAAPVAPQRSLKAVKSCVQVTLLQASIATAPP